MYTAFRWSEKTPAQDGMRAALALHFPYYNFCRIHSSLKVTPAMENGVTDHVWSIEELIAA